MREQLPTNLREYLLKKKSRKDDQPLIELGNYSEEHLSIITRLVEISSSWNPIEIYTPSPESIKRERETLFRAFRNDTPYNPHFSYTYAETLDLSSERKKLSDLFEKTLSSAAESDLDRVARVAIMAKIRDDLATCDLSEGIKTGNDRLTASALKKNTPVLMKN